MDLKRLRRLIVLIGLVIFCTPPIYMIKFLLDPNAVNLAALLLWTSVFVVLCVYAVYLYWKAKRNI
jgi:hypothetical protein